MATTVNYAASLVTRKTNYSSNGSSNSAAQEFYEAGSNNVGIICFSGMNLANKVIQEIIFTITATVMRWEPSRGISTETLLLMN